MTRFGQCFSKVPSALSQVLQQPRSLARALIFPIPLLSPIVYQYSLPQPEIRYKPQSVHLAANDDRVDALRVAERLYQLVLGYLLPCSVRLKPCKPSDQLKVETTPFPQYCAAGTLTLAASH